MDEPEVVRRVHRFLRETGIDGRPLSRLFTDPHPTLTAFRDLQPFQRFGIGIADFRVHPDLLGQEQDGESLVAIEAKGERDLLKGLAQAEAYQDGVQRSFLAASASALGENFVLRAREKGVGILAVGQRVEVLHVPPSRRPLNELYRALIADVANTAWITEGGTYSYNLPTHYLVWVAALPAEEPVAVPDLDAFISGYPMPSDRRAALRGAAKLGLVRVEAGRVMLTDVGRAVRGLLPDAVPEWAAIHRDCVRTKGPLTLIERCRPAGLVLRLLLLRDPVVQLVLEGLRALPGQGGSFRELAKTCAQRNWRQAVIFFLNPEATEPWVPHDGAVEWDVVPGDCFRSTTFLQYKSVLKHAGLICPDALGGVSSRAYQPERDLWRLAAGEA